MCCVAIFVTTQKTGGSRCSFKECVDITTTISVDDATNSQMLSAIQYLRGIIIAINTLTGAFLTSYENYVEY